MYRSPAVATTLAATLAASIERYVARTPRSRAQYDEALRHLPGGNTRTVLFYEPYPLAMQRGQAATLWDADDHAYTDLLGEFTAGLYGHSNPVIRAAIDGALDRGISLSSHNVLEARFAGLIRERFASLDSLRFTNSGTEANLLALAAAKAFTGRAKVMVFVGAYHGGVLTFVGGHSRVNVPHDYVLAPYNDIDATRALLQLHAKDLAAVLVEPMQGAGGCIVGDPPFLAMLRVQTAMFGALLIFDEVMTSRLAPGGRQASLGIRPDLTTLGKYIGGGMSFGAFGGRHDVMAQFDPRRADALSHAGTFNNNVLTMSAGFAGLEQLYTQQVALALNAAGDEMRERLNAVCRARGVALQFSGLGSLMNFHPTAAPIRSVADAAAADQRIRDLLFFFMLERGFYIARRGFTVLSLPITPQDIDRFVAAFDAFAELHEPLLAAPH